MHIIVYFGMVLFIVFPLDNTLSSLSAAYSAEIQMMAYYFCFVLGFRREIVG
jgi:hypothetical protein